MSHYYRYWRTALAMQLGGGGGHAAATTTGQGGGGGVISRKEAKQLALLRQNEAKMQLTALSPKFASAGMQATLEAVGVGTQDQPTWVQVLFRASLSSLFSPFLLYFSVSSYWTIESL